VKWEQSFTGFYPTERRIIKYDLGTEKSFSFKGRGVVLQGLIRKDARNNDNSYVAQLEARIDGKEVKRFDMPYDYITRKYEIFSDYDLTEGTHQLTIKWLNPDERYAVQCKDLIVYSSQPSKPINPYQ
jgi:hypothetical protein